MKADIRATGKRRDAPHSIRSGRNRNKSRTTGKVTFAINSSHSIAATTTTFVSTCRSGRMGQADVLICCVWILHEKRRAEQGTACDRGSVPLTDINHEQLQKRSDTCPKVETNPAFYSVLPPSSVRGICHSVLQLITPGNIIQITWSTGERIE